jgi:hypothetical protein
MCELPIDSKGFSSGSRASQPPYLGGLARQIAPQFLSLHRWIGTRRELRSSNCRRSSLSRATWPENQRKQRDASCAQQKQQPPRLRHHLGVSKSADLVALWYQVRNRIEIQYGVVEARMDCLRLATDDVERSGEFAIEEIRAMRRCGNARLRKLSNCSGSELLAARIPNQRRPPSCPVNGTNRECLADTSLYSPRNAKFPQTKTHSPSVQLSRKLLSWLFGRQMAKRHLPKP